MGDGDDGFVAQDVGEVRLREKTRWVCKIESLKDGKKQARDGIKKV